MANTNHYRDILKENKARMVTLQSRWEGISKSRSTPEHGKCAIRSVLGQTQLIIAKKFEFMEKFLNKADEQKDLNVNNDDLQGLWDMICIEVENLNKKYEDLDTSVRNGWRRPTGPRKQTSSKPHDKNPAPAQGDLVPTGSPRSHPERSFTRSFRNDTPFRSLKSSFTISVPTKTPSTSESNSTKVVSAPTSTKIRSKAVAKNPFSGLIETRSQLISDADDSDAFTISVPTKTSSTSASSSAKVVSARTSTKIRSKAVAKNPFSGLIETPSQSISDADDSDAFTISVPTKTSSTSASRSTKVVSAPTSTMIRSKAVAKNPFSGLIETPSQSISDADDSDVFTISIPTKTSSTSASSSTKVVSAPTSTMIRSKAVAKNPFSGLIETPSQSLSDADDSDDEYVDSLESLTLDE